jgi:hypothetical protein
MGCNLADQNSRAEGLQASAVRGAETITQRELVVHLFCPLDAKRADSSVALLTHVLDKGIDVLAATSVVPGYSGKLSAAVAQMPAGAEPLVVRRHPARPIQLVIRKARDDMLLLSVLISPEEPQSWDSADLLWDEVLAGVDVAPMLGTRRLYLGKVPDDVPDLADADLWQRPGAARRRTARSQNGGPGACW